MCGCFVNRDDDDTKPEPVELPRPLSFLLTLALRPNDAKKAPVLLPGVNGIKDLYPLAGESLPLVLPTDEFDRPGNLWFVDTSDG